MRPGPGRRPRRAPSQTRRPPNPHRPTPPSPTNAGPALGGARRRRRRPPPVRQGDAAALAQVDVLRARPRRGRAHRRRPRDRRVGQGLLIWRSPCAGPETTSRDPVSPSCTLPLSPRRRRPPASTPSVSRAAAARRPELATAPKEPAHSPQPMNAQKRLAPREAGEGGREGGRVGRPGGRGGAGPPKCRGWIGARL